MEINKDKKNKSFWLIKHLSIFIFFWGFIELLLIGPTHFYSEYRVSSETFLMIFLNYINFYFFPFYFRPKNSHRRTPNWTVGQLSFPILTLVYPIFRQTGNYNMHQLEEQFLTGLIIWACLIIFNLFRSIVFYLYSIGISNNTMGRNLNKFFNEKDEMYRFQYKAFQGNWVDNNATISKSNLLSIQHFLTTSLKLSNNLMKNHPAGWQPAARLIDPNGNVIETMM